MPKVDGVHYPYTAKGRAAAKKARMNNMNQQGLHTAEEGKRGKKDHASQKAIKAKQKKQRAYSGGVIKKTRGTGAALRGLNYNSGGKV
jgi:hypothetical protein